MKKQIIYPEAIRQKGTIHTKSVHDKYDPRFIEAVDEVRAEYAATQGLLEIPPRSAVLMEHTLRDNPAVRRRYEQKIKESGHGRKYIYPDEKESV